ncbi:MAG: VOC family protein [Spirochaetes bacterium]|nr:VOC family protein [Spirochaetota bacterium]
MEKLIFSGIQQIGIGVPGVYEAWQWYKDTFGVDIRVFDDDTVAEFMLPYTGGKPRKRHAVLAVNLQGGGGFEIWQYSERVPKPPAFEIKAGDLGIFAAKIKCRDVRAAYDLFSEKKLPLPGSPSPGPDGAGSFFLKDPYNNIFQIVPDTSWFKDEGKPTGGTFGAIIGVRGIDTSFTFYAEILGYSRILYDKTGTFEDLALLPGGANKFRRMLLTRSEPPKGAFSPLLGPSVIELVQVLDRKPKKIFEDRFWGDLGFIHLCFDIQGMNTLRKLCEDKGCPFTVDAWISFDRGGASGAFSYTEDPDGTLIEFVETHKLPIIKKIRLYLDLRKRDPEKSLPRWMLKTLSFNRVKHIPGMK